MTRHMDANTALPPNRLRQFLTDPKLRTVYENVRRHRVIISGYDITKRCNLRCEGCFFFEGDKADRYRDDVDLQTFRQFFEAEKARGITYPHMAGAEPALVPERLRVAAEVFKQGLIYTNGTLPIDKDLPFMLHISVWGNRDTDRRFRGATTLDKALDLYAGDRRAVFMYTINHDNIGQVREVVELIHSRGSRISFSHYSPTRLYNRRLDEGVSAKTRTFRLSTPGDNLRLSPEDLVQIHQMLSELVREHPDTVVYSPYYNEVVSQSDGVFTIDPDIGMATDCPILNKPYHRQYHTDLSYDDRECCIPNVDCSSCRHYVSVYTLIMDRMKEHLASKQIFTQWLDVFDAWLTIHIPGYPRTPLLVTT
jgi:MoaA/NifB/PqqE/SkfB family radical SAM enzyme